MLRNSGDVDYSALTFRDAVVDPLAAHIAILDQDGAILSVNASWLSFAKENEMQDGSYGIGVNYFDVCRQASLDPHAAAALAGIRAVLSGAQTSFYHEYPCHSPWENRWFALRATPLCDRPDFVLVSHEKINESTSPDEVGQQRRHSYIFATPNLIHLFILAAVLFLAWKLL